MKFASTFYPARFSREKCALVIFKNFVRFRNFRNVTLLRLPVRFVTLVIATHCLSVLDDDTRVNLNGENKESYINACYIQVSCANLP